MAKPVQTSGGQEYGKRLYVSGRGYQKQMRRHTDAHKMWSSRVPHSESKKPYLPDQKYQEMEYFDFPWDYPNWPGLPGFPDDTTITDQPDINGYGGDNPPKDYDSRFMGCNFYVPLMPSLLSSGETAYAKLERRDDPITSFSIHGPASIVSGADARLCTADEQLRASRAGEQPNPSSAECTVIIQVDDPINTKKWGTESGIGQIVLVAYTASGQSCSTSANFLVCTGEEPELLWDSDNSASTVTRNHSAGVQIEGGLGPYKWEVSGTGFSMAASETPVDGLTNTLIASGSACGTAIITVTDVCHQTTTGIIRCTDSGQWSAIDSGCVVPGAADYSVWGNPWGVHYKYSNQYYCRSHYVLADNNFSGWILEGEDWVWIGEDGCYLFCDDCADSGHAGCDPCVSASVDGGGIYTGTVPIAYRASKIRCCCEVGFYCFEWTC